MSDNDDERRRLVPDLDDFISRASRRQHLRIADLQVGDVLTIVTRNHRYQFKVLDIERRRVEITSNHPDFPGPYVGYFQGSVIHPDSGTMFLGRAMLGFCVIWSSPELLSQHPLPIFALTATQEVLVNGFRVLPADHDGTVQ